MNKAQLIDAVAKETGLSKADSIKALDAVLKNISKGLKKAPVGLVGFGTFKQVKRKARIGRNPATGAKIKIAAKTVVQFKPSKNPKY